jgi:hypothetical protein
MASDPLLEIARKLREQAAQPVGRPPVAPSLTTRTQAMALPAPVYGAGAAKAAGPTVQDVLRKAAAFTDPSRRAEAASIAADGGRAKQTGWKGFIGDVLENPVVSGVLSATETLSGPMRAGASFANEVADIFNGGASFEDFKNQANDPTFGWGKVIPDTGAKWFDRAVGLAGDVAFDPVTYVTFGAGKFAGQGGRLALAKLASEKGFSGEEVNRIAQFGRAALRDNNAHTAAQQVEKLGLNRAGLHWYGTRITPDRPGWVSSTNELVGQGAETALAKIRLGAQSLTPRAFQKAFTKSDVADVRLAFARGDVPAGEAKALIEVATSRNAARFTSGRAATNGVIAMKALLDSVGNAEATAYRNSVHRLLESPKLYAQATPAEQAFADRWIGFFRERWKEVDDAFKDLGDEAGFDAIRNYFPHMTTEAGQRFVAKSKGVYGKAVSEIFNSTDPADVFNHRKLREGYDWFGYELKADDLNVERLNQIARDYGGFKGDFFETDIVAVAERYIGQYAQQMGVAGRLKALKNAGYLDGVGKKLMDEVVVDPKAVERTVRRVQRARQKLDASGSRLTRVLEDALGMLGGRRASLLKQITDIETDVAKASSAARLAADDLASFQDGLDGVVADLADTRRVYAEMLLSAPDADDVPLAAQPLLDQMDLLATQVTEYKQIVGAYEAAAAVARQQVEVAGRADEVANSAVREAEKVMRDEGRVLAADAERVIRSAQDAMDRNAFITNNIDRVVAGETFTGAGADALNRLAGWVGARPIGNLRAQSRQTGTKGTVRAWMTSNLPGKRWFAELGGKAGVTPTQVGNWGEDQAVGAVGRLFGDDAPSALADGQVSGIWMIARDEKFFNGSPPSTVAAERLELEGALREVDELLTKGRATPASPEVTAAAARRLGEAQARYWAISETFQRMMGAAEVLAPYGMLPPQRLFETTARNVVAGYRDPLASRVARLGQNVEGSVTETLRVLDGLASDPSPEFFADIMDDVAARLRARGREVANPRQGDALTDEARTVLDRIQKRMNGLTSDPRYGVALNDREMKRVMDELAQYDLWRAVGPDGRPGLVDVNGNRAVDASGNEIMFTEAEWVSLFATADELAAGVGGVSVDAQRMGLAKMEMLTTAPNGAPSWASTRGDLSSAMSPDPAVGVARRKTLTEAFGRTQNAQLLDEIDRLSAQANLIAGESVLNNPEALNLVARNAERAAAAARSAATDTDPSLSAFTPPPVSEADKALANVRVIEARIREGKAGGRAARRQADRTQERIDTVRRQEQRRIDQEASKLLRSAEGKVEKASERLVKAQASYRSAQALLLSTEERARTQLPLLRNKLAEVDALLAGVDEKLLTKVVQRTADRAKVESYSPGSVAAGERLRRNLSNDEVAELRAWRYNAQAALDAAEMDLDAPLTRVLLDAATAEAEFLERSAKYGAAVAAEKAAAAGVITPKLVDDIRDGWEKFKALGVDGLQADDAVVKVLQNMDRATEPEFAKMMNRFLGRYTTFFKAYATATPGFHVRNGISNTFMLFGAGATPQNLNKGLSVYRSYTKAVREGIEPEKWLLSITDPAERALADTALRAAEAAGGGQINEAVGMFARRGGVIKDNKWLRASRNAGQVVEGSARFMLAYDSAVKGLDFNASTERVMRFLFDYTDKSAVDKALTQIIPFWIWMSRNLPLQIVNTWTNPKAYLVYESFMRNMGDDDTGEVVPFYLREQGAIKIADGWYLSPDTGFQRTREQLSEFGDPLRLASYVSPAIRIVPEVMGNRQFYNAVPFRERKETVSLGPASGPIGELAKLLRLADNVGPEGIKGSDGKNIIEPGETVVSSRFNYALRNLIPPLAVSERVMPSSDEYSDKVASSRLGLFGVPVKQVTDEMRAQEVRRRERELETLRKQAIELGYKP